MKLKIVNKRRFGIFMFVISLSIIILINITIVNARENAPVKYIPIYVEPGDTLWSITSKNINVKYDIRDYIDKVIEFNKLKSANIKVGQLIYLPIEDN